MPVLTPAISPITRRLGEAGSVLFLPVQVQGLRQDGNEVLPQDTTHFTQRTCYQRGSPCQDPAGNRTTRRPYNHRKETQTAKVWSCLPFIRSGQNHLARHVERATKTRQTEEEVERQHQGMDRPGVRQVLEGGREQGKIEETGCKITCDAPNYPHG